MFFDSVLVVAFAAACVLLASVKERTLLGYVALFFAAACFFLSADIASKMTPPGSVPLQWGAVALFLAGAILLRLSRELKERTPRLIHEIARSRLFRIVHLTAAT